MGLPIFYADPDDIDLGSNRIVLTGDEAKHAAKSLRVKTGDKISVGDGKGYSYVTRVVTVDGKKLTGAILSHDFRKREKPSIIVYQAISKLKAMDETIARNAETGAEIMIPFISERSPHNSFEKSVMKRERWTRIARESSKLSRRKWMFEIGEVHDRFLDTGILLINDLNIVLWENEKKQGFETVLPEKAPDSIGLIVGPEGGISEEEVEFLEGMGAVSASMGELNYRTESAGAYAAMLIRFRYGNLKPEGYV